MIFKEIISRHTYLDNRLHRKNFVENKLLKQLDTYLANICSSIHLRLLEQCRLKLYLSWHYFLLWSIECIMETHTP